MYFYLIINQAPMCKKIKINKLKIKKYIFKFKLMEVSVKKMANLTFVSVPNLLCFRF